LKHDNPVRQAEERVETEKKRNILERILRNREQLCWHLDDRAC